MLNANYSTIPATRKKIISILAKTRKFPLLFTSFLAKISTYASLYLAPSSSSLFLLTLSFTLSVLKVSL